MQPVKRPTAEPATITLGMGQEGNAQLSKIVAACGLPAQFTSRVQSGKQHRDQNADDGDHHQQFNERKCG